MHHRQTRPSQRVRIAHRTVRHRRRPGAAL